VAAPDEKTQSLIRRLRVATERGIVEWEAKEERSFRVLAPTATVSVQSADDDGGHPYFVEIRNADGLVIGGGNTIPGAGYADWEEDIAGLYLAARNSALGIDQAFRELADDLKLPSDPNEIPF
jgi:hypothetical protein